MEATKPVSQDWGEVAGTILKKPNRSCIRFCSELLICLVVWNDEVGCVDSFVALILVVYTTLIETSTIYVKSFPLPDCALSFDPRRCDSSGLKIKEPEGGDDKRLSTPQPAQN